MTYFYAYHSPGANESDFLVEGGYGVKRKHVYENVRDGDSVFIIQKTKKSSSYELCGLYLVVGHYYDKNSENPYRFQLELVQGGKPWIKLDEKKLSSELKLIKGDSRWSNFKRHFCRQGISFLKPLESYVVDVLQNLLPCVPELTGEDASVFEPIDVDRRKLTHRQIKERRGQAKFRRGLLERYGAKCMVSNSETLDVLEAAHISWYRGEEDNHLDNGLILRADIHTLFDLNLIGIMPETLEICVKDSIFSEYGCYHGSKIAFNPKYSPSKAALEMRYQEFLAG